MSVLSSSGGVASSQLPTEPRKFNLSSIRGFKRPEHKLQLASQGVTLNKEKISFQRNNNDSKALVSSSFAGSKPKLLMNHSNYATESL